MSDKIERREQVTVTYKNGIITLQGSIFSVQAQLSSSELSKVYWGSTGKGVAKVTVNPKEEPKPAIPKK